MRVDVPEATRSLVERIDIHPPAEAGGEEPRIEVFNELTVMLRAAGVGGLVGVAPRNTKSPAADADGLGVFLCSELLDAGTRKHLDLLLVG